MLSPKFTTAKVDIDLKMSPLYFCDIVYFTLPNKECFQSEINTGSTKNKLTRLLISLPSICTSGRAGNFFERLKSNVCWNKARMEQVLNIFYSKNDFHYMEQRSAETIENQIIPIATEIGYSSVAMYSNAYNEESNGVFIVLSNDDLSTLKSNLREYWIRPYFDLLNFYYPRVSASIGHSMSNHGLISEKTMDIVKLTSQGANSKSIAEVMHLTERGVEYHLEKARDLLNASNKVELISVAKERCLI